MSRQKRRGRARCKPDHGRVSAGWIGTGTFPDDSEWDSKFGYAELGSIQAGRNLAIGRLRKTARIGGGVGKDGGRSGRRTRGLREERLCAMSYAQWCWRRTGAGFVW